MEQAAKRARPEAAPDVDEDVNDEGDECGEGDDEGEECGEGGDESGDEGEGSGEGGDEDSDVDGAGGGADAGGGTEEDKTLAPSQFGANTPTDTPVGGESESESTEGDAPERVTENDFFKVLEKDMDKLQEFTRVQVMQIRAALKDVDKSMKSFELGAVSELPLGAKEQLDAIGERFMVKSVVKYAEGNPPCLSMHDCATLKSHIKCMAVGCELVDPDWPA